MTLIINVQPETERGLLAQAQAKGISPTALVEEIVAREVRASTVLAPNTAKNLVELFETSPFRGLAMTFERDQDYGREIDL